MSASKILVWGVAVLALGLVLTSIALSIFMPGSPFKHYSVVSTNSGFYVGRVSSYPFSDFLVLRDAYIIDNIRDENNQLVKQQLTSIAENSLWGSSKIYINKQQVLFKSRVEKCSPIYQTLNQNHDCPALDQENATPPTPPAPNNSQSR